MLGKINTYCCLTYLGYQINKWAVKRDFIKNKFIFNLETSPFARLTLKIRVFNDVIGYIKFFFFFKVL